MNPLLPVEETNTDCSFDIFSSSCSSSLVGATPTLPPLHPQNVERMFTALRDMVRPEAPGFGRPLTRGEVFRGQLEQHWSAARIVSFDIFDTAIVRKCQAPRDVFLFLTDHAPFKGLGDSQHFAVLRQQAEDSARRRVHTATGSAEANLHEIHTDLAALAGLDASLVPSMVAAEEAVELSLCITHPFMQQVYRRAHATGKTVWFVSDSYHSAAFLRRLVSSCGFSNPADVVFSSSDERASKGGGKLLPLLLAREGVKAAEFVHVGDNLNSDCVLPGRAGINGVWHPLAGALEGAATSQSREQAVASGLAAWGSRTFEPARPFWWRFGYSVAGPLLVGFALWLHEKLREDGVSRAYFMLRDGDVLKRIYDITTDGLPDVVPSQLLETSRRAFMLPALGPSAPSLTSQLFVSENPRPVRNFLERLCVRTDDLLPVFLQAGFTSPDEIIGSADLNRLTSLFSNPRVIERISHRSAHERDILLRYLRQERVIGHTERVGLVDIGWNATIQKSLNHAAKAAREPNDVIGYYIGTFPAARRDAVSPTRGYLCDYGLPRERLRPLMEFPQLIELICTSARGSLLRFEMQGKRAVPVVAKAEHDAVQLEAIRELHEGAADYAALMREQSGMLCLNALSPDAAASALFRVITQPTAEEALIIGGMQHGDGMGASASRHLARFGDANFSADSILGNYARAYWKAGLLNQHTPQAMMLRALLWLHDG